MFTSFCLFYLAPENDAPTSRSLYICSNPRTWSHQLASSNINYLLLSVTARARPLMLGDINRFGWFDAKGGASLTAADLATPREEEGSGNQPCVCC